MHSALRRSLAGSRRARVSAFCALVLAGLAGIAAAFALMTAPAARADEPPTTTAPITTEPAPDPAPPAKPAPKPKPKPAPAPAPAPRQSHVQTYQPPSSPPVVRSQPATSVKAKPRVRVHAKKKVRHKKAAAKHKVVLPKVQVTPKVGAVGVQQAFQTKSGGSRKLGSLLIVMGLALAIACFVVAVVPATYVKWRPAAIFVSERQVDLTVVGLALLVITAAFTFFWTKGP